MLTGSHNYLIEPDQIGKERSEFTLHIPVELEKNIHHDNPCGFEISHCHGELSTNDRILIAVLD